MCGMKRVIRKQDTVEQEVWKRLSDCGKTQSAQGAATKTITCTSQRARPATDVKVVAAQVKSETGNTAVTTAEKVVDSAAAGVKTEPHVAASGSCASAATDVAATTKRRGTNRKRRLVSSDHVTCKT